MILMNCNWIMLEFWIKMAETKSTSRAGSKLNLNESTMPLLDEEAHEKAETPEKDAIEMKEKASTTSEGEKDDSNPEKSVNILIIITLFNSSGQTDRNNVSITEKQMHMMDNYQFNKVEGISRLRAMLTRIF